MLVITSTDANVTSKVMYPSKWINAQGVMSDNSNYDVYYPIKYNPLSVYSSNKFAYVNYYKGKMFIKSLTVQANSMITSVQDADNIVISTQKVNSGIQIIRKVETHALLANKIIKKELNGDHTIELEVHQQKNNALDLNSISEMWTVTYKNIDYKIVYVDKITKGNSFYLKLRGKPLFYDDFSTSVIHYRRDGSVTAVDAFERIFAESGYSYALVNSRSATTWDGFGNGQSRLDLFKQAIDKFGLEFYIQGKTIYLVDYVGNDTNFLYKHKLNASNVKKAIDATAYFTHIKGFGNYADKGDKQSYLTDAKLKLEYTHPLASVIGVREAPPIVDGRITQQTTLEQAMKNAVDNSLNVTVEATLHDLRKQGYAHGIPQLGDRTFLIDERIELKQEIRVYGLEEHYDERDVLKDCNVDFGSQSIRKRYKSNITAITSAMQKVLEGRLELPFNVLNGVAKDMVSKIQSASTELIFENGIQAWSKDNPNVGLILNSAGLYITTDGGKTAQLAMTGEGIVANTITSGQILTHLVRVVGTEGLFYIDGDIAKWTNATNPKRFTQISPDEITTSGTLTVLREDGGYPFMRKGYDLVGQRLYGTMPAFTHPQITISGQRYQTDSSELRNVDAIYFEHFYNSLKMWVAFRNNSSEPYNFKVGFNGFGDSQFSKYETGTCPANETVYLMVEHFLGIPDGVRKQFYIEFASLTSGKVAQMSVLDVKNVDVI